MLHQSGIRVLFLLRSLHGLILWRLLTKFRGTVGPRRPEFVALVAFYFVTMNLSALQPLPPGSMVSLHLALGLGFVCERGTRREKPVGAV